MNKKITLLITMCTMAVQTHIATAQNVVRPCPEVLIEQKYDHVPQQRYRNQNWDTAITCDHRQIELTAHPYIPVQFFNGTYLVEEIPYSPADPTFHFGNRLPNNNDDQFCSPAQSIPYNFYFFGIKKTHFVAGGNGILTFNPQAAGNFCAFGDYSNGGYDPIPWQDNTGHIPTPTAYYRDAIYGVYQDTDPSGNMSGNQGIWYGIKDSYPCRKIICSWNEIPWYANGSNTNNRQTYQIVCYEGSNIIEVHVKRRRKSQYECAWCNWGLIGIQNATGKPQEPNEDRTASNGRVVSGSPAAFWPTGCNTLTNEELDTIAYRFTPQGSTSKTMTWYRLMDDGEAIQLGTEQSDTNGWCKTENGTTEFPTLTAYVKPTKTTRYVLSLFFFNANGDPYHLYDTITIGIDTINDLRIAATCGQRNSDTLHTFSICRGQTATCKLQYTEIQQPRNVQWTIKRVVNGQHLDLPDSLLRFAEGDTAVDILPAAYYDSMPQNAIDSIYMLASVEFTSGCVNYDTFMLCVYPNFDLTERYYICQGDDFVWHTNNQPYYSSTTEPYVNLHSQPGCDSVVHLDLTVFEVTTTIDTVVDCKPITWLNGITYNASNSATTATDTLRLTNRYGCDSIVQLMFTMHPLTARIQSNIDYFSFDNLTTQLTDISTGGGERTWLMPDGSHPTDQQVGYTIPLRADSADIRMVARSQYGHCIDTARIVIPFNKETFWLPNAFTPGDPNGHNTTFHSISSNTLSQQMHIFNRNGELVFQCEGIDCQWDGRRTDGTPCPQGAYVYIIRYSNTFQPRETYVRSGTVTLIR